jgi:hypothetical protein
MGFSLRQVLVHQLMLRIKNKQLRCLVSRMVQRKLYQRDVEF